MGEARNMELLAPAGNPAVALAAFDAGADAVYCGLQKFNARERSENFSHEELAKVISKFFKPDKIKSTFLKRGDFGLEREIKPKIKVRVAPLRRVKNAGAKVVRKLGIKK